MRLTGWALTALVWALTATANAAQPLQVAVDDYCPYYCKASTPGEDRLADPPGFVIEILQHAFGSGPEDIRYNFMPWKRSVQELSQGSLEAIVMAAREEAPGLVYPEIEQGRSQGCFYKKRGAPWVYAGPESLSHVRLTLVEGYQYGEPLNSFVARTGQGDKLTYISGNNALLRIFQMIERRRTEVTAEDSMVAAYLLQKSGLKQGIDNAGCYQGSVDLYVGFSPHNPDSAGHAKVLAEAMIELRSNGQLARILGRYGLVDWR